MLLYDCKPAYCSVPAVMDAFVECWVRPTVHSTSSSVSQSVINEGGDGQPGCILITHKDKERYGKEEREGIRDQKKREWDYVLILQFVWSVFGLVKILFGVKHKPEFFNVSHLQAHIAPTYKHTHTHMLRHTEYPHSLRSKHGDMKDTEGALWG